MNEVMEKVDNLIFELDQSVLITSLKEVETKVLEDLELQKELEEYHMNPNSELKNKILSNPTFCLFKEKECDLNLFIMEINQKLKKITEKGVSCEGH